MKKSKVDFELNKILDDAKRKISELVDCSKTNMPSSSSSHSHSGYPEALKRRSPEESARIERKELHIYGSKILCRTDTRGFPTPKNRSPLDLKLDATEGFIPLWEQGSQLRWRFKLSSMDYFEDPTAAMGYIKELFRDALMAWGDATPITFSERDEACDFEIVMKQHDDCQGGGCTLAAAFFPDGGRHGLEIYPKMFTQSRKEQVDNLIHETGHIFGLRHFFADISESAWPSVVFGEDNPFSIMNYGANSELTEQDRSDLATLYEKVWDGTLKTIQMTPIRLVRPFSALH